MNTNMFVAFGIRLGVHGNRKMMVHRVIYGCLVAQGTKSCRQASSPLVGGWAHKDPFRMTEALSALIVPVHADL